MEFSSDGSKRSGSGERGSSGGGSISVSSGIDDMSGSISKSDSKSYRSSIVSGSGSSENRVEIVSEGIGMDVYGLSPYWIPRAVATLNDIELKGIYMDLYVYMYAYACICMNMYIYICKCVKMCYRYADICFYY